MEDGRTDRLGTAGRVGRGWLEPILIGPAGRMGDAKLDRLDLVGQMGHVKGALRIVQLVSLV